MGVEPLKHQVDASWLFAKRMDEQLHGHVQGLCEHELRWERGPARALPTQTSPGTAWTWTPSRAAAALASSDPPGLFPSPWASLLSLRLTLRKGLGLCSDCPPQGGQRERLSGESFHTARPCKVDASVQWF